MTRAQIPAATKIIRSGNWAKYFAKGKVINAIRPKIIRPKTYLWTALPNVNATSPNTRLKTNGMKNEITEQNRIISKESALWAVKNAGSFESTLNRGWAKAKLLKTIMWSDSIKNFLETLSDVVLWNIKRRSFHKSLLQIQLKVGGD